MNATPSSGGVKSIPTESPAERCCRRNSVLRLNSIGRRSESSLLNGTHSIARQKWHFEITSERYSCLIGSPINEFFVSDVHDCPCRKKKKQTAAVTQRPSVKAASETTSRKKASENLPREAKAQGHVPGL